MNPLTIKSCIQLASRLATVSDSPRLDVELLLAHILQKSRTYLLTWPETELDENQANRFQKYFSRRVAGEPIAHIIGVREFWSLPLAINNSTLIPRPDTELLVEATLNLFVNDEKKTQRHILDLGTGTGAIVLALAHEKKYWHCVGVDKEFTAIELAEKNRNNLHLNNVHIQQSNWFETIECEKHFDAIVSNPPYIDSADPHLLEGDVRFEPRSALVAGKKGLADIEIICAQAKHYLKNNGWLLLEHGYNQGEQVRTLFSENNYREIKTLCDLNNNERVTLGTYN